MIYNADFYLNRNKITRPSALVVCPIVFALLDAPQTVCDFGCGVGTWLKVFSELGTQDVLGLEGDWLDTQYVVIPFESLKITDLSSTVQLNKIYDLAVSLEVAEHIDEKYADVFVDNIAQASDTILFSAAIPGQGGVNHVNEQPHQYWIDKFENRGYVTFDCIRWRIANNPKVFPWYQNNIYIFSRNPRHSIKLTTLSS